MEEGEPMNRNEEAGEGVLDLLRRTGWRRTSPLQETLREAV